MSLSLFAQALIGIHVAFGSIALLTGSLVLVLKKGDQRHQKIGKVFYSSMLLSAVVACLLALLPQHENVFLFCIGLFTIYLLLAGYRGLRFRKKNIPLQWDKRLALGLGITGLVFITFPILLYQKINVITSGFGVISLYLGLSDLRMLRRPQILQQRWLNIHLGKTIGAYLASVTAFVVVNNVFVVPMWNWFGPSIIGSLYIVYWNKQLQKNNGTL